MDAPRKSHVSARIQSKEDDDILDTASQYSSVLRSEQIEESEVTQETVRTYAKQIPTSPVKHSFKASAAIGVGRSLGRPPKKTLELIETDNKENRMPHSSLPLRLSDAIDEPVLSATTTITTTTINNQMIDINTQQRCTKMITRAQTVVTPRQQKDILFTQERSFNSAVSNSNQFYCQTLPSSMSYDCKGNVHSGQISLESIQPKKSLISQLSELSARFVQNTKQILNTTFTNRHRCKCEIQLNESQTCDHALLWLKKHYSCSTEELKKMKQQYEDLLKMTDIYAQHKAQIDRDVVRTFPNEALFSDNQPLSNALKNVLYAFSVYDLQIGYVQGMNSIVAAFVYHAEEYIAFWLTCMLFEQLEMRDIYLPGFPGMKKHVNIMEFLMWKHIPFLHDIFMDNEIEIELFCQSWILSLCGNLLPLTMTTDFIAAMIDQGWNFFYRFVIAFILIHEDAIVTANEPHDVLVLLTSSSYQSRQSNGYLLVPNRFQPMHLPSEGMAAASAAVTPMRWSQLIQIAQNINLNDVVVHELIENYDPPDPSIIESKKYAHD